MIERFLRNLSLRRRIILTIAIFLMMTALALPLIINNHAFLGNRVRQVTEVEANVDRKLLLASTRVTSSRVNLLRYSQDYTSAITEAIDDVDQASQLISDALNLIENQEQKEAVTLIGNALTKYKLLIGQIENARNAGENQNADTMELQASRMGNDINQQIELIVSESQNRISNENQNFLQESRSRTLLMVAGYLVVLGITLFMGRMLEASITRPVAELNNGTEAFRLGLFDTRISIMGSDELSLLAQTFNQMAEELSQMYTELETRVENRTQELELRSNYLEASSQVANAAASILNRRVLIQQAVELIQEHFDLYYVGLFEVDETNQWAIMKAGTGDGGKAMLARQHKLSIGGSSMIGWSIYNQHARIALEAGEDPVRLSTEELPETRSEAAIPMRARGRVIGAISVQSTQPNAFDQDIITVLQTMADQVGIAMDNAQLFTETQDALATSMRAYGQSSQKAWQSLLGSRQSFGFTCDPSGVTLLDDQDLLPEEQLALSQRHTIVGDANQQNQQNLAIPIKIRGNLIGVLDASKSVETGSWTQEEINLIETITEQLEIALDGAQLFDQTQRRAQQERVTSEITARLHETLDPDTVLKTALREFGDRFGFTDVEIRMNPHEKAK